MDHSYHICSTLIINYPLALFSWGAVWMFYNLSAACANVRSLITLWNTYLTNELQLKVFVENYVCARSPDVQGSFPLTRRKDGQRAILVGQDDGAAATPQTESPPLPKQVGSISGCQASKCCKTSQTWSPQASPFPVWLCSISTHSHAERAPSCRVWVAAWTLRRPLTKLGRLSRWREHFVLLR